MSISIAKQMKETILDMETCRKCKEFAFEYVDDIAIPFCKIKWFEERDCPYEEEAEAILRDFGIALGEARAEWCERVLAGEDVPMFIDEEQTEVI
jgi:hypothetical protein